MFLTVFLLNVLTLSIFAYAIIVPEESISDLRASLNETMTRVFLTQLRRMFCHKTTVYEKFVGSPSFGKGVPRRHGGSPLSKVSGVYSCLLIRI